MDAATKALLAGKGAMVCKVTPGYSRASTATNTLYPVLWVADSETYSLLSLYNIADSIYWSTYDGSSACYVATPIECGETDTVIIRWGFLDGAQEKYQIGFLHGTTWTWRDAVNFDGSYVIGNDLIVGYGNEYPFHIQGIKFYSDPYTRTFFESRY